MAKDKTTFTCYRMRRHQPALAGQMPVLRRLEHPDRAGGRGQAGQNRLSAPRGYAGLAHAQPVMPLAAIEAQDVARTPAASRAGTACWAAASWKGWRRADRRRPGHPAGSPRALLLLQALDALQHGPARCMSAARRAAWWRCAPGAWAGAVAGCGCWPRIQLGRSWPRFTRAQRPRVAVIDSIRRSIPGSSPPARWRRNCGECAALDAGGRVERHRPSPGGPRHEGRRARRGRALLEHMVDTVLYFEGDTQQLFRLVRAIKNRFGAVNGSACSRYDGKRASRAFPTQAPFS